MGVKHAWKGWPVLKGQAISRQAFPRRRPVTAIPGLDTMILVWIKDRMIGSQTMATVTAEGGCPATRAQGFLSMRTLHCRSGDDQSGCTDGRLALGHDWVEVMVV